MSSPITDYQGSIMKQETVSEIEIAKSEAVVDVEVTLLPRPSRDPNDPLNWSALSKSLTYGTVCFFGFVATLNGAKFNQGIIPVAKEFHKDTKTAGFLVSFGVLSLGIGNLFWICMMRMFGRRPVFLMAIPLVTVFNVWSAKATSYNQLMASTVLASLAGGAGEAPVCAVVADLYFAHQRGRYLMVLHIALSAGIFVGNAIHAPLAEFAGWRWICWWISIVSGATWLVAIFTVRETAYVRPDVDLPATSFGPRKKWIQTLGITSGYNKQLKFITVFWNTISVGGYPAVVWSGVTIGIFVGWTIVVQVTSARMFSVAPYNFKLYQIGLLGLSGFVGAALGIFFGGLLIDIIANRMTLRHGNQRQAEYRLPGLILPAIVGPMGILTFGLCMAHKTPWIGQAFGYGMAGFGITVASNVLTTYAIDAYLPLAGEALVTVFVIRGIIGCVISLYASEWIKEVGVAGTFGTMVGIQYCFLLLGIVFYFYGRRLRNWTASYGPLKHLGGYM